MAKYYCDHGAYGITTNRLGLDNPTWGTPQDGDGTSKDAATSVAIASIQFTAVPTSGTFSVCGATVSTTGVLNAANVATAANTLATNINATTNTVVTTVSPGAAQLRNLVYARGPANGAPTGTCQIMMRIGSANLNTAQNSSAAIASTFNNSPTLSQFAGGSGGCWGWFINHVTLGVSNSIGLGTYGVMLALPYAGTTPNKADTLYVRTGGSNKTITFTVPSSNAGYSHAAFGTNFIFDTNTEWTGDTATGKLKLYVQSLSWGTNYTIRPSAGNYPTSYIALAPGGFEIEFYGDTSTSLSLGPIVGSETHRERWVNVIFRDSGIDVGGNRANFMPFTFSSNNGAGHRRYESCQFVVTTPRSTIWQPIFTSPYNTRSYYSFRGCTFDMNISGLADPGALMDANSYISDVTHEIVDCEFKGRASGFTLVNSTSNWQLNGTRFVLIVDGCRGLRMPNTYLGLPTPDKVMTRPDQHLIVHDSRTVNEQRGYRYEDCRGVLEWLPDDATPFPTLSATIMGSGIPYSMRAVWLQMADITGGDPFEAPPFKAFNQLSSAQRTLTLELFIPSSITRGVSATFSYTDITGVVRTQFTNNLSISSAVWSNSSNYTGFVAKKLSIQTEYEVALNTELSCRVTFSTNPPEATTHVYINPELSIL